MKLSFENNGTRLQLETPKQFDMATGTAFLALARLLQAEMAIFALVEEQQNR